MVSVSQARALDFAVAEEVLMLDWDILDTRALPRTIHGRSQSS